MRRLAYSLDFVIQDLSDSAAEVAADAQEGLQVYAGFFGASRPEIGAQFVRFELALERDENLPFERRELDGGGRGHALLRSGFGTFRCTRTSRYFGGRDFGRPLLPQMTCVV